MKTKKNQTVNRSEHTPTPWKVAMPLGEGDIQIQSEKVNAYGNFINAVIPFREFTNEDKANAEFIVRAVNSHEALLEALKLSVLRLKEFGEQQKKSRIDLTSDLEKAITLAEGKGE